MFACRFCAENYYDIDSLMDHMTEHIRQLNNTEAYGDTAKDEKVKSDSEQSTSHRNETYKFQSNFHTYNEKKSQSSRNSIIFDGNDNDDSNTEEMDASLMVKREELSSLAETLVSNRSNNDITTGSEASSLTKQLEAIDDKLVNNVEGTSHFSSDNNTTSDIQVSLTSRIKFDSDDDTTMLAYHNKSKQKRFMNMLHRCDLCDEQFAHKRTLIIHRLKHIGKTPFSCDICGNEYWKKSMLNVHKNKHDEKKYTCEICQKQFTYQTSLRQHLIIHGSKKYECDYCEKKFSNKYNLRKHIVIHTDEKRYTCIECDVSFRNYSSLSFHRDSVHSQTRPKCKICHKDYANRSGLLTHYRNMHSNVRGFTCKVCNEFFKYKNTLVCHMAKHNGYPLKCSFCEKGFTYKYHLARHERFHTGEKPFQCDACNRTFKKKETLANHIVKRACKEKKRRNKSLLQKIPAC